MRSPQCNDVAQDIWERCETRDIWLSVAHIPGICNELAEYKSQNFSDNTEWSLKQNIFDKLLQVYGEPEIDLFVTRLNAKV